MIPITVIRHPKERRSKCSLRPLEARAEMTFYRARPDWTLDVSGFTILALGAPELSPADAGRPLLLLDSTWRLLPQLETCLRGEGIRRTLPAVPTAYPRVSKITVDPSRGLASVEALYLAKLMLGERDDSILAEYYWAENFMHNLKVAGLVL
jgi:pre-rRNA-processing protein TSR3